MASGQIRRKYWLDFQLGKKLHESDHSHWYFDDAGPGACNELGHVAVFDPGKHRRITGSDLVFSAELSFAHGIDDRDQLVRQSLPSYYPD